VHSRLVSALRKLREECLPEALRYQLPDLLDPWNLYFVLHRTLLLLEDPQPDLRGGF
jgi:hypothetical protein